MNFESYPKITRWSRDWVITEKIDGTNAQVLVPDDPYEPIKAGSRNRYLTVEDDNYGFAKWVSEHQDDLRLLGPGRHFGEWWGPGIQRGYGVSDKRFSLFNPYAKLLTKPGLSFGAVPILEEVKGGASIENAINYCVQRLKTEGSIVAPGFMKPEGIVIYHVPSRTLFKKLLENDEVPKGE